MQVLVAVMLTLSGVSILVGGPPPGSVTSTLPTILVYMWAAILACGGTLVVGAAIVTPVTALFLEIAGDLPLSLGCFAYASAVVIVAGGRGTVTAAILVAMGIAFGMRFWQVLKTLRALRAELRRRAT